MKDFKRYIVQGYKRSIEQHFSTESYSILIKEKTIKPLDESFFSEYTYPSTITNTVIKQNIVDIDLIEKCIQKIELLQCKFIVLIYTNLITLTEFKSIVKVIEKYNIHKCTYVLNFSDEYYSDEFAEIILNCRRIDKVILFESPFNKNLENLIFYFQKSRELRSNILKNEFISNRNLYSESQSYHTYFNRKLFIDENWEIKNAPETIESFGKISEFQNNESIFKIINSTGFQKYWFAKKKYCDVCQHCEYRNMCVDNRVPVLRKNNEWFHNIECNYNPYIAKWNNEEGFLKLQECGVISNKSEFSIDHKKIAKINKELWGDD